MRSLYLSKRWNEHNKKEEINREYMSKKKRLEKMFIKQTSVNEVDVVVFFCLLSIMKSLRYRERKIVTGFEYRKKKLRSIDYLSIYVCM